MENGKLYNGISKKSGLPLAQSNESIQWLANGKCFSENIWPDLFCRGWNTAGATRVSRGNWIKSIYIHTPLLQIAAVLVTSAIRLTARCENVSCLLFQRNPDRRSIVSRGFETPKPSPLFSSKVKFFFSILLSKESIDPLDRGGSRCCCWVIYLCVLWIRGGEGRGIRGRAVRCLQWFGGKC